MYNQYSNHQQERAEVELEYAALYDPFVVQSLQSVLGRNVVVETSKGSIRGKLADVKPDHICIHMKDATFFIRIQEIVWFMPY
ncbi:YuzF family protein [Evansella sp. AB-rgal1]|uniref:YuzF family protein n=1 Tax=Evansella sp. AB-rgal1 TaxID=3242696 RepID=UPI00359DA963